MPKSKNIPVHYSNRNRSVEERKGTVISVRRIGATALTAGALAGLLIANEHQNRSPEQVNLNQPYRVITAKRGSSEWGLGVKAFPDLRPEIAAEYIADQNPNKDHLVTPGQEFVVPASAEMGKLIDPSAGSG